MLSKHFLKLTFPVIKLPHASIKKFWDNIAPSESVCRGHVNELAMQELERVKEC